MLHKVKSRSLFNYQITNSPNLPNLPTPPPLASTRIPKELFHSTPDIRPQNHPKLRQTGLKSRQIRCFYPYGRPVCGVCFGVSQSQKPTAKSRSQSTFSSPQDQSRKRTMPAQTHGAQPQVPSHVRSSRQLVPRDARDRAGGLRQNGEYSRPKQPAHPFKAVRLFIWIILFAICAGVTAQSQTVLSWQCRCIDSLRRL
jgi:hypothetical protein